MTSRVRFRVVARCMPVTLVVLVAFATTAAAQTSESGNFCVRDYQGGAVCTANDVRIEEIRVSNVDENCSAGVVGEFQVDVQARLSANGSPDRYDIGFFLAQANLTGLPARDGDSCYHSFLYGNQVSMPTYGDTNSNTVPDLVDAGTSMGNGWWDGGTDLDSCGDIETNTEVIITLDPDLRFPCVDEDMDGVADIHACASWDNNTNTTCSGLAGAFPGTNSKCGCSWVSTISDLVPAGVPCGGNCNPPFPVILQSFAID